MAPKRATRSTPVTENPTTTTVTNAQLQAMIDQGVTAALAARDANRNGDDNHTSGTGARRTERVARECTYQDFMKCQPLYFKGTEGVVELTQWFERMETVFRICYALIVGHDVAYAMTWIDLRKKMTDKYCPRNEIKKLEAELWNLKVKGTDVTGYNQRFQELALLCVRMFPEESDKVERYVGGLPDMIHGSVVASKPKTMQEATKMATELMDKKISTFAERQAENKRKLDNNHQAQQQLPKRQNVVHLRRWDCSAATNNQRTLTCYECGNQGHYKSDCPKLKNRNHGNQAEGKDHVMLRVVTLKPVIKKQLSSYIKAVSPWKGVVRFGKRGKLNPRDAGPFKALARVEALAYKLSCLEIVPIDGLHIGAKLQIVEEPVEIMDREVKRLKQSRFPIVKVRWNSRRGPEFIWE
ncbi:reverse transcriptase domain-containing protein [Tanacetum coccineum]